MEDRYLINYNIFVKRTGFSLRRYITNNKDVTYNEVCFLLKNKKVEPLKEEHFNHIKNEVLQLNKIVEKESDDTLVKEEKPQPKKRRRRRKTKND